MDVDPDIDLASKSRQPFQHQRNDDVPNGHSFRSFRSQHQYRPNTSYPSQPQHSHSFSGGGGMFRFNVPDSNGFAQREREYDSSLNTSRPSTANTARPGTSTRPSTATTLPPLKSVLPSSVAPLPPPSRARPGSNAGFSGRPLSSASPGGSFSGYGNSLPPLGHNGTSLPTLSSSRSTNGLRLPPPTPSGFDFRPGSRSGSSQGSYVYRPGTAPAMGPGAVYPGSSMGYGWEDDRSNGDSPFSFNAPPLSSSGSRKRGFSAVDEGDGERTSESRPQSRRLSVMELCAPDSISGRPESSSGSPKTGGILFTPIREPYSSATSGSRPGTSGTGLIVRGAAGLDLGDRENGSAQSVPKSYELFARAAPAAGGSITKNKRESPNTQSMPQPLRPSLQSPHHPDQLQQYRHHSQPMPLDPQPPILADQLAHLTPQLNRNDRGMDIAIMRGIAPVQDIGNQVLSAGEVGQDMEPHSQVPENTAPNMVSPPGHLAQMLPPAPQQVPVHHYPQEVYHHRAPSQQQASMPGDDYGVLTQIGMASDNNLYGNRSMFNHGSSNETSLNYRREGVDAAGDYSSVGVDGNGQHISDVRGWGTSQSQVWGKDYSLGRFNLQDSQ
ncbi:hypothetical protein EV361DRAFT_361695 [Lentinula raphanica]|nr:hypothetical protein EV361DRAFT_361695 [Lentinula raphanica]